MTAVLGFRRCPVIGCRRMRHVSPSGIRYGTCISHATDLLGRAFRADRDAQQRAGAGVYPRAHGSDSLPVAVPAHRPAA